MHHVFHQTSEKDQYNLSVRLPKVLLPVSGAREFPLESICLNSSDSGCRLRYRFGHFLELPASL